MVPPLHLTSEWSLGYGVDPIPALVARAAAEGWPAVPLADLENLCGQVHLHHACRDAGLRAVTGLELRRGFHPRTSYGGLAGRLVLLARDEQGYARLCRIVSRRRGARGDEGPGADPVAALEGDATGLWVLTESPETLQRLRDQGAAPEALRLHVREPSRETAPALEQARRLGVSAVAGPAPLFLEADDHALHRLQVAIRRGVRLEEVGPEQGAAGATASLSAAQERARRFVGLEGAVAEGRRLLEACALDLTTPRALLPELPLPPGVSAQSLLVERCRAALRRRRGLGPEYAARLERELAVVGRLGYAGFLLAVAEVAAGARSLGLEVAGRGSAAGSLVVHLLGATQVDPVAVGLDVERFLHPDRLEPPDVDLDVPSARRDELIGWVFERFGPERVAMIAAHQRFGRRAAFRQGLKALGLGRDDLERFCRALPPDELVAAAEEAEGAAAVRAQAATEVPTHLLPAPQRRAVSLLERLVGRPRHLSVHPGGVVVADRPIDGCVPLELAPKGVVVTQYDMRAIGRAGLVKLDLLGNRCLGLLQGAIDLLPEDAADPLAQALRREGTAAIPAEDPLTLATIDRAATVGCFQLESPAVRGVLARLPVRALADVMAALAVVRPGAAAGAAKEAFLRRARGEEPAPPLHPALAARTAATGGLLLYEEDIAHAVATLTGLDLGRADRFRAEVLAAGADPEALAALEGELLRRASARGVPEVEVRPVWEVIARFAAYSFNKAHAASYALLGYQAAFLRTHLPAAWGAALLDEHGGSYPLRTVAAEVARLGVPLLPPCVQGSAERCTLERGAVRLGLARIKRLSEPARRRLFRTRAERGEFLDVDDLVERVRPSRRELEALVLSGACDALAPLAAETYPFAHQALLAERDPPEARRARPAPRPDAERERLDLYRSLVRVHEELRHLDMAVTAHPMALLRSEARAHGCATTVEAASRPGRWVRVAGVLSASRHVLTRGGQRMQFLTLDDEEGLLEAVVFPPAHAACGQLLTTPGPFLVEGRVAAGGGAPHLVVGGLQPFHARERPYAAP